MPTTLHPSPNEVVKIAASEEIPKRISAGAGTTTKVYFGASVTDAHKEVSLDGDKNEYLDVAQPVLVLTDAATLVLEGIAPVKPLDEVAYENFPRDDLKVEVAKEPKAAEQKEVAESNEDESIPSLQK